MVLSWLHLRSKLWCRWKRCARRCSFSGSISRSNGGWGGHRRRRRRRRVESSIFLKCIHIEPHDVVLREPVRIKFVVDTDTHAAAIVPADSLVVTIHRFRDVRVRLCLCTIFASAIVADRRMRIVVRDGRDTRDTGAGALFVGSLCTVLRDNTCIASGIAAGHPRVGGMDRGSGVAFPAGCAGMAIAWGVAGCRVVLRALL